MIKVEEGGVAQLEHDAFALRRRSMIGMLVVSLRPFWVETDATA